MARSDEPLPAAREEITLPRDALERIIGEYAFQGAVLTVFLDGDAPKARLTGQPVFGVFAESPSKFFRKVVEATLEFVPEAGAPEKITPRLGRRDDQVRAQGLNMRQGLR